MAIPFPSCFGKKSLEGVENKGSAPTNTEKRAGIALKTLSSFCSEIADKTVDGENVPGAGQLLGRSWTIILVSYNYYWLINGRVELEGVPPAAKKSP